MSYCRMSHPLVRRLSRPQHPEQGFILIYVVVMIAALTVLLGAMQRIRPPSGEGIEKQLGRALQAIESRALLDYVRSGLRGDKNAVDPRYEAYYRIFRERQSKLSETDDRVAFLREVLRSLNYDLNIQDPTRTNEFGETQSELAKKPGRKKQEPGASSLAQSFFARKEPFVLNLGDIRYEITIHPANALPNLNHLNVEALVRYLKYLKIPEAEAKQLAGAISDWRDSDDFTSDHGAESDYYQRLQPPYRPRNGNIRNWQELAYLRGMSPELLQLLRESFTLDGPGQAVLADYAPRGALAALSDLPEATIKIALEHQQFGGLGEQRVELREILLDREATAFQEIATFSAHTDVVRIGIAGPQYVRHIRYDVARGKVLGEW